MKRKKVFVILGVCAVIAVWYWKRWKTNREIDEFDRLMREWKAAQKISNPTEKYAILNV